MSSYVLTGGTGNVTTKLAALLHSAGFKAIVASTKGPEAVPSPSIGAKFDWKDESTYSNPFKAGSDIKGVYIVAPFDVVDINGLKKFIEVGRAHGVNRFIALTSTTMHPQSKELTNHLIELSSKEGVEWTTLRPTWFFGKLAALPIIRDLPC